jgi:hypothetical protein
MHEQSAELPLLSFYLNELDENDRPKGRAISIFAEYGLTHRPK